MRIGDKVWTGHRHGDAIKTMGQEGQSPKGAEQGFITETGEFLNRREAFERAVACRQIADTQGERILVSEDLY